MIVTTMTVKARVFDRGMDGRVDVGNNSSCKILVLCWEQMVQLAF